jgi:transposase-like protein
MLRVVDDAPRSEAELLLGSTLDELAREGARRMLMLALEAEVAAYIERHAGEVDEEGHCLVVRNGHARPRPVTLGCGTVEVRAPRVNDRRTDEEGTRQRFTSEILPPYMRRSPKVDEVLPVLYLRGLSTGDFQEALPILLGEQASGLSPTAITRLTNAWKADYEAFCKRSLADRDFVYVWADGVHFRIRLEDDRLCTLVLIGVRPDGSKELIAVADGYRESAESWSDLLRDLSHRGMQAPVLAIGDGALGFWAAVRDVWPETREQRCWVHRIANVLDKLPKRLQPKAKAALNEIMNAPTKAAAEEGVAAFRGAFEAKYPKAVASLTSDSERLLTLFDFPAEHWVHLRTTNPIESTFATVRLRQRVTKGAGSRQKGLTMAYKLLDMAQARWRKITAAHLVPLVRAGVQFKDGVRVERDPDPTPTTEKLAA